MSRLLVSGPKPHHLHAPKRPGDVGYDLCIDERRAIGPLQCSWLKTGVKVKIPGGCWAEIKGRSSAIPKWGILVVNSVIDEGFTGELTIGCFNLGGCRQILMPGLRLAQLIIHRSYTPEIDVVDHLPRTERGDQGFGSTGTLG